MPRRLLVGLVVLALVAVAAVAAVLVWRSVDRTGLERAVSLAPGDTARYGWTDWAAVRTELGSELPLEELLDRGFDRDLTSGSSLVESAPGLSEHLGLSPATVDWELFSQSEAGAVTLLGLPSEDFPALEERLADAGYSESGGVWSASEQVMASLGGVSPQFNAFALDADEGVVRTSDTSSFLSSVEPGSPPEGVSDVVSAVASEDEPLAAIAYSGDQVCSELAMANAGDLDQEVADELLAEAGDVHPLTGFAMAAQPGGDVLVAMGFETDDQARTDADTRSRLAAGPAPGQGGDFADRFRLGEVRADGRVVTMELEPVEGTYLLSDLSTGPVLFATC